MYILLNNLIYYSTLRIEWIVVDFLMYFYTFLKMFFKKFNLGVLCPVQQVRVILGSVLGFIAFHNLAYRVFKNTTFAWCVMLKYTFEH